MKAVENQNNLKLNSMKTKSFYDKNSISPFIKKNDIFCLDHFFEKPDDMPVLTPELRKYTKGDFETDRIVWYMVQMYGKMVKINTPFRLSYLAQKIKESGDQDKNNLFRCDVLFIMSTFYCPFMRIKGGKIVQV